jgi:cytochrome c553
MTAAPRWLGALIAGVALAWLPAPAPAGQPPAAEAGRVDFHAQVRPLLSDRCFRCHGPDAAKRKAKLRLDTPDGVLKALDDGWAIVTPGNPSRSELIRRILVDSDDDDLMPPRDSHLALSEPEKALLERWVSEGAEYRSHWALEPVRAPPVPALPAASDEVHPIDAFVRARLAREGIEPAPRADPATILRRLALNLTGLPSTLDEIDTLAADDSPAALGRAVEHYLASPAYGERMAVDWLDLARYADTYGYQADVTRDMSAYRDWVIGAFNDNLPYDQFLTWQLAGDLLPDATREQRLATAFNRLHRQTNEGGSIEEEFRAEYVMDRVNTFGTAMLGLTLECARCHDHKFDPISHRDYFSLFAFFNSIDESGLYSHFTNATPTPTLLLWPAHEEQQHHDVRERLASADARQQAVAAEARAAFLAWLPDARLESPAPIAHLTFDGVIDGTTPDPVAGVAARLQDAPILEAGVGPGGDGALRFSGDNAVVHPGVQIGRAHV